MNNVNSAKNDLIFKLIFDFDVIANIQLYQFHSCQSFSHCYKLIIIKNISSTQKKKKRVREKLM